MDPAGQSIAWSRPLAHPDVSWAHVHTQNPTPVSSGNLGASPGGGLILSPAGEVLPRRLVEKIGSHQYVDMRELLLDNISLLQQLKATQGTSAVQVVGASRPRLREVSSLTSWCYCFLGYMAVLTTDPTTRDQLAYARLLIREAQRHGGQSWLDYDRAFRQQVAANPSIPWNTINPGLQAATMFNQSPPAPGLFCTWSITAEPSVH